MNHRHITIQRLVSLKGPNIWTYRPVIEAWLDFSAVASLPAHRLKETYTRLNTVLPALLSPGAGIEASKDLLRKSSAAYGHLPWPST